MNFEGGQAVAVVEPEIFFDDPAPEPEREGDLRAALDVVFVLGRWAGFDPVRVYACDVVMHRTAQSTSSFAHEHRVSDSFVRRRIREAKALIGSAVQPHE